MSCEFLYDFIHTMNLPLTHTQWLKYKLNFSHCSNELPCNKSKNRLEGESSNLAVVGLWIIVSENHSLAQVLRKSLFHCGEKAGMISV